MVFHTPLPLRVFSCIAFVHVSKHLRDKLDPQALKCVFIGYSPTQKCYKCYHPTTKKFYVSKDVTFIENRSFFPKSGSQDKHTPHGDTSLDLPILDTPHKPQIHYPSILFIDDQKQ